MQNLLAPDAIAIAIKMAAVSWIPCPDRRGACGPGGGTIPE